MEKKLSYSEIENILEKAIECVEYYQREYLNNKIFTLYLANGERVKYAITPASVPHLLGIDLYALKGIINLSGGDLLSMLKELLERSYELNNKFRVGILKQEDVFSDHIFEKIENFKANITADVINSITDTQLVCCYKSEKSWEVTTENKKYDYIIVKKSNNGKILLLGIVRNGNRCYAMSNQVFENQEMAKKALSKLITNQEITMLTGMDVYNTYNESNFKWHLVATDRAKKSRELSKYKKEYDCNINISAEYESTVSRLGNNGEERHENKNTIEDIVNAIANGKLIPTQEYENSMLISLIDAWNDHICKVVTDSNTETQISYTKAITDLIKFRNLVTKLEEENRTLQQEASSLIETNAALIKENSEQKQIIDNVYEIIKPRIS